MGAVYRSALSLLTTVLLVLTVPMAISDGSSNVPQPVHNAMADADSKKREAEATAADAQDDAQARAEGAKATVQSAPDRAQDEAQSARLTAEDAILLVLGLGTDAATLAYDYAVDQVQRVRDFIDPLAEQTIHGKKPSSQSSVQSQSSNAVVVPTYEVSTLLLVAAASTGSALLVALLVRRLLTLGLLPLLSRISHDEIYNNESRRTVNELVQMEAGLCLNEIVTRTGYSRNAVSYHLFVLEKEEAIVSVKDGKYRRYFTRNGKYVNGAKNVVAALRNETTLKLAQAVLHRPGAIQRDLCVELGATPSATCWHAKRLLDLGVIRKERVANTVQYFPGETLAKYDLGDFGLRPAAPAGAAPVA